jgi:hypothetical protein
MYVCMYVCLYVCIYTHKPVYRGVCVCVCVYAHARADYAFGVVYKAKTERLNSIQNFFRVGQFHARCFAQIASSTHFLKWRRWGKTFLYH